MGHDSAPPSKADRRAWREAAPGASSYLVMQMAASRPGAWLLSRILPPLDLVMRRLTGGQRSLAGLVTGLPMLYLTATGARSGKPRTVPLIGAPVGEEIVVIASNWGKPQHPAWYHNIQANPLVTVEIGGCRGRYRATEVTGEERAHYWQRAVQLYPGYTLYRQRASNRQIPVIVLRPAA